MYEIEKILKKRGKGKNVQYLVKWLGYPNKFNSWVSNRQFQLLVYACRAGADPDRCECIGQN